MRGLPAGWYVDPARGPLEFSQVFLHGWQFVCHVADLPAPGTAARFDCGDRSAFVLRTRAGTLQAFRNACSHRGARLIDGDPRTGFAFVLDGRVRCPYHGWCYDEHGRLESVPAGQAFDAAELATHSLHALPVVAWRGLVFACLDVPERALDEALGTAAAHWPDATAMRRLAEPRTRDCAADWKLACEHRLDTAHLRVVRSTPAPQVYEPDVFAVVGPDAVQATGVAADVARAAWPARACLRLSPPAAPAQFLFLWPNLLLLACGDELDVLQVLPVRTGACTLRLARYGTPDGTPATRRRRYLHERAWRRVLDDDARRLERLQHGLANLAADASPALDARQPGLHWFAQRLRSHDGPVASTPKPRTRRPRKSAAVPPGPGA